MTERKAIIIQRYLSPCGELLLGAFDGKLCLCDWQQRKDRQKIDKRLQTALGADYTKGKNRLLDLAVQQLDEYFSGKRQYFDVPLLLIGTTFQRNVWSELIQIPYATTLSYRQVAQNIGKEKSVRPLASAIGANAISIFIPCHRVIGSNGSLTGYAGGLAAKQKLLLLEKAIQG